MPTIGSDIFKQLDDLISIDVGSRGVDKLHVVTTKIEGGPTCMKAAETLCNSVQTKRPVMPAKGSLHFYRQQRMLVQWTEGVALSVPQSMGFHPCIMGRSLKSSTS